MVWPKHNVVNQQIKVGVLWPIMIKGQNVGVAQAKFQTVNVALLDEILGVHGLLLLTHQACTRKYPGVHAQTQACMGSLGTGAGGLTNSPKKSKHEVFAQKY